jgi:hypothetical protein
MTLIELTPAERKALAQAVGCNPIYLHQLATRFRNKKPSPELCRRLVAADRRLTLEELRPDIWGDRSVVELAQQGGAQ